MKGFCQQKLTPSDAERMEGRLTMSLHFRFLQLREYPHCILKKEIFGRSVKVKNNNNNIIKKKDYFSDNL